MKATQLPPHLRVPVITGYDEAVLDRIGNTPLLKIQNIVKDLGNKDIEIYAKAEWTNPAGSVKARPALRMVRDGLASGAFKRGMELIDSTSGNTGVAYALIGRILGFKVNLVLPGNVCKARKGIMAKQFKANLILSDPMEQSDGAIKLCRKLYAENRDKYFLPDQYNNPSNWMAHRDTTAREIYEQSQGRVTHFLAGIGTSGTLMGTTRGLKALNPAVKSYAVEPAESLHGIEGLKHMESSIVPGIYDTSVYDEKISVTTDEAYHMVSRIEEEEGLLVGTSSGAALAAAMKLAARIDKGVLVIIFPDSCEECVIAHGEF